MQILAHRGYWNAEIVNNSPDALRKALEYGYGFESDVRDYCGKLVISHNIADKYSQDVNEVFGWLREYQDNFCFAINIKADGLKDQLVNALNAYQLKNYFTFDMSIPQMIEYKEKKIKFFTRQSEVEAQPVLYYDAAGVWIDGFFGEEWITETLLKRHLEAGKQVCLVSPDLHGREYRAFWKRIRNYQIDFAQIMLCTDHPDEAREYFDVR